MHIKIAERLRPFSHVPGTQLILQGSTLRLTVFPTRIECEDMSGPARRNVGLLKLDLKCALEQFTVEQDLEKGCIRIWGKGVDGFIRYRLHCGLDGHPYFFVEKGESSLFHQEGIFKLGENQALYAMPKIDRLSLGSHKSQDWTLIKRRCDLMDILPIWHRLGQMVSVPNSALACNKDTFFSKVLASVQSSSLECQTHIKQLFLAGFEGMFSPRIADTDHQGFCKDKIIDAPTPLSLLTEGAALIRSLFIQQSGSNISLLPLPLMEFHCGRLIDVPCGTQMMLSMEWTKKELRCITFTAQSDQTVTFAFCQKKRRCRLRTSFIDDGKIYHSDTPLHLVAGQRYCFDRFE